MKLKLLAAALALVAAGSANAAIDGSAEPATSSGNGSLFASINFVDTVTPANSKSATFDLGFTMDQAVSWNNVAGLSLEWDLATGVFTSNNTAITGAAPTLTYDSVFTSFNSAAGFDLAKAQLSVIALDGLGTNVGDVRVLTTGNLINGTGTSLALSATTGPSNGQLNATPNNGTVTTFIGGVNSQSNGAADGATLAASGTTGYYNNGAGMDKFGNQTTWFDNTGLYGGQYAAGTGILSGQDKALPFFLVQSSSGTATGESIMTRFGFDLDGDNIIEFDNNGTTAGGANEFGLWTLQGSTLKYSVASAAVAPVPEADTWAMLLAGLGMVGMIARRRKVA